VPIIYAQYLYWYWYLFVEYLIQDWTAVAFSVSADVINKILHQVDKLLFIAKI